MATSQMFLITNSSTKALQPDGHFYRLAQTDISGKVQFSDIKTIKISKQSFSLQVSPNPVHDKIILTTL
jgi:hypothetical protein